MTAEPICPNPRYVSGRQPGEVWAHFPSGTTVLAGRDRARHFPGLEGAAPFTLNIYRKFDDLGLAANHVLDAGCGAGAGLRHLCSRHHRATGVDRTASALRYARELAPAARLMNADLATFTLKPDAAQVAYMVDVLGHLAEPVATLARIGRNLDGSEGLCLAEPTATVAQRLEPPARFAFSECGLKSILVRSGFTVERWLGDHSEFRVCYAVALHDRNVALLQSAEENAGLGRLHVAEMLAKRAHSSSHPTLRLESLLTLARIQVQQSRRDAAVATLSEIREAEPNDPRAPAGLSLLARTAGADAEAFALAREAVSLDATELTAVVALATLLHDSDPAKALVQWTAAHALAPDHAGVIVRLCDSAVRAGDYLRAIAALEQSRRYDCIANDLSGSLSLAWMLAQVGRGEEAAYVARQALKMGQNRKHTEELIAHLRCLSRR